jgi:hypothetical protein
MNNTNTVCDIAPRHRQKTQYAVGGVFIFLSTLAVILRLMGRPPFSDAFGTDDVLALIGYVSLLCRSWEYQLTLDLGCIYGRHKHHDNW